jgi:hypothetical protein
MGEEPTEARLPRLMALVWPLPLSHAVESWGTWTPTGSKEIPLCPSIPRMAVSMPPCPHERLPQWTRMTNVLGNSLLGSQGAAAR